MKTAIFKIGYKINASGFYQRTIQPPNLVFYDDDETPDMSALGIDIPGIRGFYVLKKK